MIRPVRYSPAEFEQLAGVLERAKQAGINPGVVAPIQRLPYPRRATVAVRGRAYGHENGQKRDRRLLRIICVGVTGWSYVGRTVAQMRTSAHHHRAARPGEARRLPRRRPASRRRGGQAWALPRARSPTVRQRRCPAREREAPAVVARDHASRAPTTEADQPPAAAAAGDRSSPHHRDDPTALCPSHEIAEDAETHSSLIHTLASCFAPCPTAPIAVTRRTSARLGREDDPRTHSPSPRAAQPGAAPALLLETLRRPKRKLEPQTRLGDNAGATRITPAVHHPQSALVGREDADAGHAPALPAKEVSRARSSPPRRTKGSGRRSAREPGMRQRQLKGEACVWPCRRFGRCCGTVSGGEGRPGVWPPSAWSDYWLVDPLGAGPAGSCDVVSVPRVN